MEAVLYRRARWTRSVVGVLRDPDRPVLLAVAFWVFLLATVAVQLVDYGGVRPRFDIRTVAAVVAAQAICWLLLPWNGRAGRRRRLALPAFLLTSMAAAWVTDYAVPIWTLLIGLANAVIVFGVRGGLLGAVAILAWNFIGTLTYPGHHLGDAVYQTAVLALIVGSAVSMAAAFAEVRRRREESQRLLIELESAHAELRRYSERVSQLTIAEERARMAREMHDSIGHHLTVIKVGLENAERLRTRSPQEAWREVRQAKKLTQEALSEVRRWVRALRPLSLERHVGTEAMAALATSFAATGVQVSFDVEGTELPLDADTELVLYRALQEGLTNSIRHSGACHVRASLAFGAEVVALAIEDDGRGAQMPVADRGFGLSALGERARAIGGRLAAGNGSPGGFTLKVELPIVRP